MESKTYYARVAGSKYIFSDGIEAIFAYGRLVINAENFPGEFYVPDTNLYAKFNGAPKHEVYQKELDAIIGKNPNIFLPDKPVMDKLPEVKQNAKSEAEIRDEDRTLAAAGVRTQVQQETGAAVIMQGDVNASTIDPDIAKAMLENQTREVGPGVGGQSKLEEIRARTGMAAPSVSSK